MNDERSNLLAQISNLSEQLAEYRMVVCSVVEQLGHSGNSPDDLYDAVTQIVALVDGEDSAERTDLTGLADRVCRLVRDRDQAVALLSSVRSSAQSSRLATERAQQGEREAKNVLRAVSIDIANALASLGRGD